MLHQTKERLCGGIMWLVVCYKFRSPLRISAKNTDNSGRYSHDRPQELLNITSKYGSIALRFPPKYLGIHVSGMMLQNAHSIVSLSRQLLQDSSANGGLLPNCCRA